MPPKMHYLTDYNARLCLEPYIINWIINVSLKNKKNFNNSIPESVRITVTDRGEKVCQTALPALLSWTLLNMHDHAIVRSGTCHQASVHLCRWTVTLKRHCEILHITFRPEVPVWQPKRDFLYTLYYNFTRMAGSLHTLCQINWP